MGCFVRLWSGRLCTGLLLAVLIGSLGVSVLPASAAPLTKAQQKCVNALNKDLGKINAVATKQISGCLKNNAKGKAFNQDDPAIDTLAECTVDDPKDKISGAEEKATEHFASKCLAPLPPYAMTDVATVAAAAKAKSAGLASGAFGEDLDAPGLLVKNDDDEAAAKCQGKIWKALAKCEKVRQKEFSKCKKKGLKDEGIDSTIALETLCLTQEGDPATSQPDPKGKIEKACGDPDKGIAAKLGEACEGQDLAALFPDCGAEGTPAVCFDEAVACELCVALNVADALERNCDAFDNGLDDGSCGCGDGVLTPAEECDDGDLDNDDGCSNTCVLGAGLSCLDILNNGGGGADGLYSVETPSGPFEVHCDFSSAGGGWTRVGILDGVVDYCTSAPVTDLRADPNATSGKVPDADVQAFLTQTPASPVQVMFYVPAGGRFLWHDLENVTDFDTATRHTSSSFYCTDWHCDDGSTDATVCGGEGAGCPVTGHGSSGTHKKVYVDFGSATHIHGMHINGSLCGLPNYTRQPIWVYVR